MHPPTTTCCSDFAAQYALSGHPDVLELEREVLGCSYGGTSWTTRSQADRIAGKLALKPGSMMLEVGSGTGWPAIYVSSLSGARLTMVDLPMNALKSARSRSLSDLEQPAGIIQANGAALPFHGERFDALGHSDVLCCLPEKHQMLRECRRVARPGAKMLFFVIATAKGLKGDAMTEAIAAGPPFVESETDYASMLQECGWRVRGCQSLTYEYQETLQRMVNGLQSRAQVLRVVLGEDAFDTDLARRKQQVQAVKRGLLVRESYLSVAT